MMDRMQLGIFVAAMIALIVCGCIFTRRPTKRAAEIERRTAMFAKFFDVFWGWADYRAKDWSNAPYKRGYAS
jgi:hypothetical protein